MDRWDAIFALTVALIIGDWAMSAPLWHLEGNPVALELGIWGTLGVKLFAVTGLSYLWLRKGFQDKRVARVGVAALFGLHALVVTSNAAVIGLRAV